MRIFLRILFGALLLHCNTLFAQDGIEELKSVNKAMQNLKNMSADIVYRVYKNYYSTKPVEETRASVKKADKSFLTVTEEEIALLNQDYFVLMDKRNKQLFVDNAEIVHKRQKDLSNNTSDIYLRLDSLARLAKEVKVSKLSESTRKLLISFDKSWMDCSKVEVIYNTQTHLMNKMILFYSYEISIQDDDKGTKEKPKLEIIFENLKTGTVKTEAFSEKTYFRVIKKKLVPTEAYKDYELIDQRLKK